MAFSPDVGTRQFIRIYHNPCFARRKACRKLSSPPIRGALLPTPGSGEVAASFNGATQARRAIGSPLRRPVVTRELAHRQCVLRSHRTSVSRSGYQSFSNRSAPRAPRKGYQAGLRVTFVFGSDGHAVSRSAEETAQSPLRRPGTMPPRSEPRSESTFPAPDREGTDEVEGAHIPRDRGHSAQTTVNAERLG